MIQNSVRQKHLDIYNIYKQPNSHTETFGRRYTVSCQYF